MARLRRAWGAGAAVGLWLGATDVRADEPVVATEDGEDHHHRTPGWDALHTEVPPATGQAPEYPLAAAFVPADSSNYTAGGITNVQYVVVHTMQGSYAGSISWFQNPTSDVSAHFCMRSEDGEITQMVGLGDRAWHVGNSNSVAIGIEHEGFVDDASWYTWATYARSAELARWLADHHGLPLDRDHIVGHAELPAQTHTDPGPNWNWDLYMALVHDVVGAGVVEGVVVDAGKACTLTASVDTWVKATLQEAADLGDTDKCLVPAGTELVAYASSDDIYGHRRLTLAAGACAGNVADGGFVVPADFTGACSPNQVAAAGAQIVLDGGAPIVVGDDGRFSIADVASGAHVLDASATGLVASSVPFDQGEYPGRRLVVVLEPENAGTSGDDGVDPDDDGDGDENGEIDTTDAIADSDDDGGAAGTDDGGIDPALPVTFGESEDDAGCACRTGRGPASSSNGAPRLNFGLGSVLLVLAGLAGGARRRPRA
jgi:hypothetical protein